MVKQHVFQLLCIFTVLLFVACKEDNKTRTVENIVTVRLPAAPDNLNPFTSISAYAQQIQTKIFSPLLEFDPNTLEIKPVLARSRPVVKIIESGALRGGTSYTYEIHEEARWDNGTAILATDYLFTIKLILNPYVKANALRAYFDFIEDIKIDSDNPRKFTIYARKQYFLVEACTGNIPVAPAYLFDPEKIMEDFSIPELAKFEPSKLSANKEKQLQKFGTHFNSAKYANDAQFLLGSGPYRLVEWKPDQRIVLEKKKNWWGDQLRDDYPMLDANPQKIIYRPIAEEVSTLTELKAGNIDVAAQLQANSFIGLKENEQAVKQFNLYSPPSLLYYYIALNAANPKLKDKKVRRALAQLIDVDEIIETVMYGLGERIHGPIHPAKSYFNKNLAFLPFDVENAKRLLKEAGWNDTDQDGIVDKLIDGEQVKLSLSLKIAAGSDTGKSIALLFKEKAKKAGVNIELEIQEFRKITSLYRNRDYEMVYRAWSLPPTLDDLRQIWHRSSDVVPDGSNRVSFGTEESDRIIDEIRTCLDEKKRFELYQKIQEIIYEEQPYIFLFAPKERLAIHKRFQAQASIKIPGYFENFFSLKQDEFIGN